MDKLFWLLWLADIAGSIAVVGWASLIALGFGWFFVMIRAAVDDDASGIPSGLKAGRWLLLPLAVAMATPNSNTIRVLAIASATETAASTQLGAKGVEALNAVLDKVIEAAKPAKTSR